MPEVKLTHLTGLTTRAVWFKHSHLAAEAAEIRTLLKHCEWNKQADSKGVKCVPPVLQFVADHPEKFGLGPSPTWDEVASAVGLSRLCVSADFLHILFNVAKGLYEEVRYNEFTNERDRAKLDANIKRCVGKDSLFQHTDGSHFRLTFALWREMFGEFNLRPEVQEAMSLVSLLFAVVYSRPESFDWSNVPLAAAAAWKLGRLVRRLYRHSRKGALYGQEGGNGGLYIHQLEAHLGDVLRLYAGRSVCVAR